MSVTEVRIADLVQEPIVEGRPHLDPERVAYYEEHFDDSTPVTVYRIHGRLLLADGYHRLAAAQRLGRTSIRAEVREGEQADALRFAVELARKQRGLSERQAIDAIFRRAEQPADLNTPAPERSRPAAPARGPSTTPGPEGPDSGGRAGSGPDSP